MESLDYGEAGVIKGDIIPKITLTFYAKHGDYIARVAGLMTLFILLFAIFKRGSMKRK